MPKRTKSEFEVEPVEKNSKNNIVNTNKSTGFALPHEIEHNEFIKSCISNTLKGVDKNALEKVKNSTFKGDKFNF